jgi:hypothetical protein
LDDDVFVFSSDDELFRELFGEDSEIFESETADIYDQN